MSLITLEQVSLSLVADSESESGAAEDAPALFVGTVALSRLELPPALPPRREQDGDGAHDDATRGDYLTLSLTIAQEPEPVLSMPFLLDSHQSSRSSYLLPNLTGTDPSTLVASPSAASAPRNHGWIKLSLPASVATHAREAFEAILETGTDSPDSRAQYFDSHLTLERNQLYVVDESNGTVLGQLDHGSPASPTSRVSLEEDSFVSTGQMQDDDGKRKQQNSDKLEPAPSAIDVFNLDGKEAVVINSLEPSGGGGGGTTGPTWNASRFSVKPLSAYYSPAPNPDKSPIIGLANFISHGIVIGSSLISQGLEKGAGHYVATRPATESPLVFTDATKSRFEGSSRYTGKAVVYSSKATGYVGKFATQFGDRIGKATGIQSKPGGPPPTGLKGIVAKSLVAINTIGDHLDASGKSLLESGSKSASQVVHHKYGPEARGIADDAGSSVKHCALVYIDARGVTRRALIKAVGKGALKAKMADGSQLYLTDSTDTSEYELQRIEQAATTSTSTSSSMNPFDRDTKVRMFPYTTTNTTAGGGGAAPPSYSTTVSSSHSTTSSGASTPSMSGLTGGYPSSSYKAYSGSNSKKDR